jgi:hypothetical protein
VNHLSRDVIFSEAQMVPPIVCVYMVRVDIYILIDVNGHFPTVTLYFGFSSVAIKFSRIPLLSETNIPIVQLCRSDKQEILRELHFSPLTLRVINTRFN